LTAGDGWGIMGCGSFRLVPKPVQPCLNYALDYSPAYEATVTAGLQNMMNGAAATTHFIIDTSRNGQGTLNTAQYAAAPYGQPADVISALASWQLVQSSGRWRRPAPHRPILALRLLDAYLWVKVPGESDGQCDSAGGARAWDYYSLQSLEPYKQLPRASFDPLWGMVDPAAGAWFPGASIAASAERESASDSVTKRGA
jgi:endoglucanase